MADCALARQAPAPSLSALPVAPSSAATPSVALVYNPHAGQFSARTLERWRAALVAAGHPTHLVDSLDYARAPQDTRADVICIVGGDGTARMVVEAGLAAGASSSQRHALLPLGTVNLIARETSSTADPAALVAALAQDAAPAGQYHGLLNGAAFLCCASVGPDSAVVARVTPAAKRRWGRAAYAFALIAQLWRWPRPALRVNIDGATHAAEALFVLKGRFYAGPWTLDPQADLRERAFRVLLLPQARRRDIARLALAAMVHPRFADPAWQRCAAQTVTVEGQAGVPIQADGDILGQTPARFSLATAPIAFLSQAARQTTRDQA